MCMRLWYAPISENHWIKQATRQRLSVHDKCLQLTLEVHHR